MKQLLAFLIVLGGCTSQERQPLSYEQQPVEAKEMVTYAGEMFKKLKDSLDLNHVTTVEGLQNVKIYMAKYKSSPDRIYAVSSLGQEVMYVGKMDRDGRNGAMAVLKNGEAVLISVKNGKAEITDLDRKQWGFYFTTVYHGGPGFCQRMPGESFGACYKAETDEFCDSFISCIAVGTQPIVVIVIAAACSCSAKPYPSITLWDSTKSGDPADTFLHFHKDTSLHLNTDTIP